MSIFWHFLSLIHLSYSLFLSKSLTHIENYLQKGAWAESFPKKKTDTLWWLFMIFFFCFAKIIICRAVVKKRVLIKTDNANKELNKLKMKSSIIEAKLLNIWIQCYFCGCFNLKHALQRWHFFRGTSWRRSVSLPVKTEVLTTLLSWLSLTALRLISYSVAGNRLDKV